eukprot:SAG25_NODE_8856_length_400_cov_1.338870_1_plen_56_part_01
MEGYCTGGVNASYVGSCHHGLRIVPNLRGGKAKELLPQRACDLETAQNNCLHAVLH